MKLHVNILNQNNEDDSFELEKDSDGALRWNGKTLQADFSKLAGKGNVSLIIDGKSHLLYVEETETPGTYNVGFGGMTFEFLVQSEFEKRIASMTTGSAKTAKVETLRAAMPGLVSKILVKEGDLVKTGQSLLVLEAMKMENQIKAKHDAKVLKVLIQPNSTVSMGQDLIHLA